MPRRTRVTMLLPLSFDVPEKQGRAQAEVMRNAFAAYDASRMRELAIKGDPRQTELRLQAEIRNAELRLLKWVPGIIVTQSAFLVAVFAYLK